MRTILILLTLAIGLRAQEPAIKAGATFAAKDTLDCGPEAQADAAACLDALKWTCAPFTVKIEEAAGEGDWLVRFPSAAPVGDAVNDLVSMEWYMPKGPGRVPVRAPAVVVVHESGRGMVAGRVIAKGLQLKGLHTFLIHLPGYGARRSEFSQDMKRMLPGLRQAVVDVRRARDAVAALPLVDTSCIGVQGTSLGGFVTATVAGLDRGYDRAFILLAGGNIADVVLHGARDAANFKKKLVEVGVTEEQIREFTRSIEPMRLAHRVDPKRTWLMSGKFDEVVMPKCSHDFAKAAGLVAGHHQELPVGHYSAVVFLPFTLGDMCKFMEPGAAPAK